MVVLRAGIFVTKRYPGISTPCPRQRGIINALPRAKGLPTSWRLGDGGTEDDILVVSDILLFLCDEIQRNKDFI